MTDPRHLHPFRAWALTWVAYATYYLGRKGFSVSKKTLSTELGVSEAAMGAIDTAYLSAYALGQFVNGILGDRIGARRLLGFGLFGTALACAGFGASNTAVFFGTFFFFNGLFQATGWPGTTRAMAEWTTPGNRGTVMAFWSTCYQVGGIVANWVCGTLLVIYGWRASFFGPAVLLAVMGVAILLLLHPGPSATQASLAPHSMSAAEHEAERAMVRAAQRALLKSRLLWSYGSSYFFIKFIRYALLFWLPYYLSTMLGYTAGTAAYVSSAFEVGGIAGVIGIGMLSDRISPGSRAVLSAVSLLGLAAALFLFAQIAHRGVVPSVLGLALIGALLFGPDSLLAGAAAQDAGGPRAAATATGMVNGLGSIGGMVEGLAVPQLSTRWGWGALVPTLSVLAVCAALALLPAVIKPGTRS